MRHEDPVAEDMFERARKAFFGTANVRPQANAPTTEPAASTANPKEEYGIVGMASGDDED
jgi:hypothetical protein